MEEAPKAAETVVAALCVNQLRQSQHLHLAA